MKDNIIWAIAITFMVFCLALAWILSPVEFTFNINMDNQTKDAVITLSELPLQDFIEFNTESCIATNNNTVICKVN